MKKPSRFLVPLLMGILIFVSIFWYLLVYDRDFTRDSLLSQARFQDTYGNTRLSSWFYNAAYAFTGHDESVAIELANQYKHDGNYTKAEAKLTEAINNNPTPELYTALSKTYVEQDKLLDAVKLLEKLSDPEIKAVLDAQRPAAPVPDKEPGYFSKYIDLQLESDGKYIFYTTDGSYPSIAGPHYTKPVSLDAGETILYAISVGEDGLVSPVTVLGYTITGVIEEAVFTDATMEKTIRDLIGADADDTILTDELWDITEFIVPEGVTNLSDLTLLDNLTSLTIRDRKIASLQPLSALSKLVILDLSGSRFPVEELNVLTALPSLTSLTMDGCGLSTIEGLAGAKSLTYLDLSNNTIRNLEVLSDMHSLAELHMPHNALTSLSALSGLENLAKLNVSYNALTSLSELGSCIRLSHLEADHNQLTYLNGLEKLTLLKHLSVDYNSLTDVSIIAGNTELTNLSIASNSISDISYLKNLTKLEIFDFSGNMQISALPAWPEGCPMKTIDGSYNSLTSLDSLKSMQSLTHIYMDYNQITNIDALADCFCLVQVNVYGNAIPDVSALRDKDIIVNYDPTAA